jgi:hypothetical protein
VNGEVHGGRARSTGAVVPRKKKDVPFPKHFAIESTALSKAKCGLLKNLKQVPSKN